MEVRSYGVTGRVRGFESQNEGKEKPGQMQNKYPVKRYNLKHTQQGAKESQQKAAPYLWRGQPLTPAE
ncbi:hypothetical protein GMJAKD_06955 [Candidatus Electrothrix aarhusensis]